MLVKTSFNMRGKQIVRTPKDAFRCSMGTEMETLVAGKLRARQGQQDRSLARSCKEEFDPD